MTRVIITLLIVAACLTVTISAFAAASGWSHKTNGYWCKTSGTDAILCVPIDSHGQSRGYGVGMHRDFVFVMNIQTGKRVFMRLQP